MIELIFEFVAFVILDILVEFIKAVVFYTGKAVFTIIHLGRLPRIEKPYFWKKELVDKGDFEIGKSKIYLYGIFTFMIIISLLIYIWIF